MFVPSVITAMIGMTLIATIGLCRPAPIPSVVYCRLAAATGIATDNRTGCGADCAAQNRTRSATHVISHCCPHCTANCATDGSAAMRIIGAGSQKQRHHCT